MKITKSQLKRIIREEYRNLGESNHDVRASFRGAEPSPQEAIDAYKSGYHGDDSKVGVAESRLEDAVYAMLGALVDNLGMDNSEAAQLVIKSVEETLGL